MRTVADDDVEQNDGGAPISKRGPEHLIAKRRIDHRMRAPARELIGAEVDDAIVGRRRVLLGLRAGHGSIGGDRATGVEENELRLGGKRAAGIKTEDVTGPPRRRWLVLLGIAWLLQGAVSGYFLIYGAVLVTCWLLWFVVASRRWRELAVIALTLAAATVPLLPIVAGYLTVHARHGFTRGFAEAALFSADLTSVLCASPLLTFWGWLRVGCNPESEIFPGLVLVVLCAGGAVWQWRARQRAVAP